MKIDISKPRVLIVLGGRSPEREVSVSSGQKVAQSLESLGYQVTILDSGTGKFHQIPELSNIPLDTKRLPEVAEYPIAEIKRNFQVVFIALHGHGGEDGVLQSIFESYNIPFVGSGSISSAISLNKSISKELFLSSKIPTPEYQVIKNEEDRKIGFPVVTKPLDQGSSVGVNICENEADFKVGFKLAQEYSKKVMVEKYIKGTELTVGILEKNGKPEALPVVEIIPRANFFDHRAKYNGSTQEIVPARIDKELTQRAQKNALDAFRVLRARHFGRVDMIADQRRNIYVLELNTIPGLTTESLFPKATTAIGMKYEKMIEHLINLGLNG
ncbi:D-alanine--D-alanine ligase [Candidatus Berkelbacteria bacterium CG10_big_fil_rev_8_21_14_0_10_41_12]|uniref:D-alanine--D-alanine ligase n=1 Tax=Candidatus Berkelbacteria bacterium CG10_big_fil_rev_8_21_14_0_10_41_12 TaxID=1974513 RepID=A0A2M6WX01_9BACT|nr:MAG: D-alanine--D-alanine ligase [Candidatus Berkelbacteria bacterium CG10_big_fil_rev_8_21_14_0_10_41_12]